MHSVHEQQILHMPQTPNMVVILFGENDQLHTTISWNIHDPIISAVSTIVHHIHDNDM